MRKYGMPIKTVHLSAWGQKCRRPLWHWRTDTHICRIPHSQFNSDVVIHSIRAKPSQARVSPYGKLDEQSRSLNLWIANCRTKTEYVTLVTYEQVLCVPFFFFVEWGFPFCRKYGTYSSCSSHISCCWQLCWMILFKSKHVFCSVLWLLSVIVWNILTEWACLCALCFWMRIYVFVSFGANRTQNAIQRADLRDAIYISSAMAIISVLNFHKISKLLTCKQIPWQQYSCVPHCASTRYFYLHPLISKKLLSNLLLLSIFFFIPQAFVFTSI